jgi:hypothetical protein
MPAMRTSRRRECGANRPSCPWFERETPHGAQRAPQNNRFTSIPALGFTAAAPKRWLGAFLDYAPLVDDFRYIVK